MKKLMMSIVLLVAQTTFATDLFVCHEASPADSLSSDVYVKMSHNEEYNEDILTVTRVIGDSSKVDHFYGLDCSKVETTENKNGSLNVLGQCEWDEDVAFMTFQPTRLSGAVAIQIRDQESDEMITLGKTFECKKTP